MTNAIELHPLRLDENEAVDDVYIPLCNNPPLPLFDIEDKEKVDDVDAVANTEVSTFNKFIANVIKAALMPPPLDIVRLLFIILLYYNNNEGRLVYESTYINMTSR